LPACIQGRGKRIAPASRSPPLFTDGHTQLGRVFVQEPALSADNGIQLGPLLRRD